MENRFIEGMSHTRKHATVRNTGSGSRLLKIVYRESSLPFVVLCARVFCPKHAGKPASQSCDIRVIRRGKPQLPGQSRALENCADPNRWVLQPERGCRRK